MSASHYEISQTYLVTSSLQLLDPFLEDRKKNPNYFDVKQYSTLQTPHTHKKRRDKHSVGETVKR